MRLLKAIFLSSLVFAPMFLSAQSLLTFRSPKYGYSLKYPVDFKQKQSKSGADFNAVKQSGFATVNVNTVPFDFREYGFKEVTKKIIEDAIKPQLNYFNITQFTKTKISGYDAIIIYSDLISQEQHFSQITAFVYWSKTPLTFGCCSYTKDFSIYKNLFESVISSISIPN